MYDKKEERNRHGVQCGARANEIGFLVSMAANCEATCALGVVKEDVQQLSRRDETRSRAKRCFK